MFTAKEWLSKIDDQRECFRKYREECYDIIRRYKNNHVLRTYYDDDTTYNLLYSIVETLKPVLYNRTPKAESRATNKRNILSREVAQLLENVLNNIIQSCIHDYVLNGLGCVRVVYDTFNQDTTFISSITGDEETVNLKVFEEVKTEYVSWNNVIFADAKKWEDVNWIAFRAFMTKEQVKEQFGAGKANNLIYDNVDEKEADERDYSITSNSEAKDKKVEVFEIWDKDNRKQIFLVREDAKILATNDDPLKLDGFFPIPRPLFMNQCNDELIPTPLYEYFRSQLDELEEISVRIRSLVQEIKRRGYYNADIPNATEIVTAPDNTFIPVDNFAQLSLNTGADGLINS